MKKLSAKSISLLVVIFFAISAHAYDFSEVNSEGKTIFYNIVNEASKTCEITYRDDRSVYRTDDNFQDYVGDVIFPESANGYQVIRIGRKACQSCKDLTSIVIPSSVKSIEYDAFSYCEGLTSVSIPNSVTSLEFGAFEGCIGLTSIELPNSIRTISSFVFSLCRNLTSISLPTSLNTIGSNTFQGCWGLTSITIPKNVYTIGEGAFATCRNLETITVDEENRWFNSANGCNAIIRTSTNALIQGCKNTIIPNTVKSIENDAFRGFITLTSISIPSSVTTIKNYAFSGCRGLTSIEIPTSVTSLGNHVFENCTGFTSVEIPNSVVSIGTWAFSGCTNLSSVIIPSSVTSIGELAFYKDNGLTSVISYITDVFQTENDAFKYSEKAILFVPKGLVSVYQSTEDWNHLAMIKEIPDMSITIACSDRGKVIINDYNEFTNGIGIVNAYEGSENTFVFTPDENCRLNRVLINGEDVTDSVEDNKLTTTIPPNSQIMVIFCKNDFDVNGDGQINITDVISIVNTILGK